VAQVAVNARRLGDVGHDDGMRAWLNGELVYDGTTSDLREDGSLEQPFHRLTEASVSTPVAETGNTATEALS